MPFSFSYLFRKCVIIFIWVGLIFSFLFLKNLPFQSTEPNKTLCIFTWSDVFPPETIDAFEQSTGIKVHIDYYSSNEEMLIKLKKVKSSGYDLIVPSDYAVSMLKQEQLLKPLQKEKLNFLSDLHPFLLNHSFDKNNTYSLPLQWDICGFGIDKELFHRHKYPSFTWNDLFIPQTHEYKIAMSNDPIEAFAIASHFLHGSKEELTEQEINEVKHLLIKQKKHVEAYAAPRADYILGSKNASLALSLSAYILRSKNDFPFMEFVLPEKSTTISIENVAIPVGGKNEEAVYTFLNFLYEPKHLSKACNAYGVFPSTKSATPYLKYQKEFLDILSKIHQNDYQLFFVKHLISEKKLRSLWVEIKAS